MTAVLVSTSDGKYGDTGLTGRAGGGAAAPTATFQGLLPGSKEVLLVDMIV
jgi:hypothetical protein